MPKRTMIALATAGVLAAGGWGAYELYQPTDAERMPEVAADDLAAIDAVITETYASISGPVGQKRDRERMAAVFAEGATLTSMEPTSREFDSFRTNAMTPAEYAEQSAQLLEDLGFIESEIGRTLEVYGTIAHAFSAYEGHFTNAAGEDQMVKGINSMQLIKVNGEWKMYTILWDQQWQGGRNPVPDRYILDRKSALRKRTQEITDQAIFHFIDPESVLSETQDTLSIPYSELKNRRNDVLLSTVESDRRRVFAGICEHCGKYFPLVNHVRPTECPVCKEKL